MNAIILVVNRLSKVIGNICKLFAYPFHYVLPKKRFAIPAYSKAKIRPNSDSEIPRVIWQTNYSNKSTLPVYLNYLFNRLMSLDHDYRYVSTEERLEFIRDNASQEVYECYKRINDGAAQADLWRLVVLNMKGGVYLDIDANLVWPLSKITQDKRHVFITNKQDTQITNFFLATAPNNPIYQKTIDLIVRNIKNRDESQGVYSTTGPQVLSDALQGEDVEFRSYRYTCIQGSFTNEHFQYLDKPRGKWIHTAPKDLIKDENTESKD
ncbi:glycosyl transferase [Photobacterium proteolyticum]|uniref:Glycosyl transferase n=1 Tax=Photobacterium proteolyticum TaxID=1903952 RepID=A0A1Q9GUX4_9GAMM|nr:glycosyltransferase [Photobacterium proteolyticum]OLQ78872.1 glycosyl transferase [Photobacterium proteolyticum]